MFPGFLIELLITLAIVGLVLWVVQQIPMDPVIARIIRVVVIVFVAIWLLSLLLGWAPGIGGPFYGPRLR